MLGTEVLVASAFVVSFFVILFIVIGILMYNASEEEDEDFFSDGD